MKNCIFCKIVSGEALSMKVYEDEFTLAFMDIAANQSVPHFHIHIILRKENDGLNTWLSFRGLKMTLVTFLRK